MTAAPSIAMIGMMAFLSMFGAIILSKPWMRYVALGCAILEIIGVAILVFQ